MRKLRVGGSGGGRKKNTSNTTPGTLKREKLPIEEGRRADTQHSHCLQVTTLGGSTSVSRSTKPSWRAAMALSSLEVSPGISSVRLLAPGSLFSLALAFTCSFSTAVSSLASASLAFTCACPCRHVRIRGNRSPIQGVSGDRQVRRGLRRGGRAGFPPAVAVSIALSLASLSLAYLARVQCTACMPRKARGDSTCAAEEQGVKHARGSRVCSKNIVNISSYTVS